MRPCVSAVISFDKCLPQSRPAILIQNNLPNTVMSKYGLIGFPIAHSLSPRLFKAAYGGRFRYDLLEFEDFEQAFRVFVKSCDAVNVTAPFKELAFDRAKFRSQDSLITGAANILVKTSRGLSCFNSDFTSVKTILEDCAVKLPEGRQVRKVLVVGCGGAGKAAAAAAFTLGLDVTVMNRNMSRALDFVRNMSRMSLTQDFGGGRTGRGRTELKPGTASVLPLDRFGTEIFRHDVLIYTIPSPLEVFPFVAGPSNAEQLFVTQDICRMGSDRGDIKRSGLDAVGDDSLDEVKGNRLQVILEANYRNPSFTAEILAVLPPQVRYIPGEQWLLGQALAGYGLMTGVNPNPQALAEALSNI